MAEPLRVLIVEDSEDDALLLVRALRRAGYGPAWERVETAAAMRDALAAQPWDVIIADYALPSFNALDALGVLRDCALDVPFLIVSGAIGEDLAVAAMKAGAHDYIMKSNLARLVPAVERELRDAAGRAERRQAAAALRESEERYRALVNSASDVIYTLAADDTFTSLNPAFERLTGWKPEEWVGKPFGGLVHPDDLAYATARFQDVLRGGSPPMYELRVQTRAGDYVTVEITRIPRLHDGRVIGLLGIARDVTERKRAEQALRDQEAELRQAQKMEAIGRLAGGVAHDFNNLLTVISGFTDLLRVRLPTAEPSRAYVDEIARAGERAAALTRQLLAFSRRQVLAPTVLDLNAVVADIDAMLRRLIDADVELVTETEPGLGHVLADRGQLEQVIMNLAINARDAMPQGGRLVIATANRDLLAADAAASGPAAAGPYVMLTVSDTGCGMDEETQAHIFEPFFTTKEPGEGTGLGLSTVYGIVRQSGGHLEVESALGRGTAVRVYLPRIAAPLPATAPAEPTTMKRGTETVLLVEDEDQVRALVRSVLAAQGYTVLEANSGEEALHVSERHGAPIDLLVTDVVMTGISGCVVADQLVAKRPDLRVLYLCGYPDHPVLRNGVLDPGATLLQKPFSADALAEAVRTVLDAAPGSADPE